MELSEIIREMESKRIPESVEEKASWIMALTTHSKRVAPITACLISSARRDNFKDKPKEWLDWGQRKFGFNRKYVNHCNNVGSLLLDSNGEIYGKLVGLDFGKLLAVARLASDEVIAYVSSKDLAATTRDEVRSDVSRLLGDKPKPGGGKESEGALLWDGIDAINALSIDALQVAAETCSPDELQAALDAGTRLIASCLERLTKSQGKELGPEGMSTLAQYLAAFHKEAKDIKPEIAPQKIEANQQQPVEV